MVWNLVDRSVKVGILLLDLLNRLSYLLDQAIARLVNDHVWVWLEGAFEFNLQILLTIVQLWQASCHTQKLTRYALFGRSSPF